MGTMNISLPDSLKSFVDDQVNQGAYGTSSEYVRELIRKEQDRVHLRNLRLQGVRSPQDEQIAPATFRAMRDNIQR